MTTATLAPPLVTAGCRRVIINVDDLGLSEAVNEAVIELATLGRVPSTSYMSGGQIHQDHIQTLSQLGVQVGLHLDFTGIYDSAIKDKLPALILSSYLRQLDKTLVSEIIDRQFDAFEDLFECPPAFVDGHQHVHQLPIIRQCLAETLTRRYPTTQTLPVAARVTTPLVNDFKSWVIYLLGGYAWQRLCHQCHIPTNSRFGGVYDFQASEEQLTKLWARWLCHCPITAVDQSKLAPPALIMCHPAKPDYHWQDEIKAARETEYRWLMSDAFDKLCEEHHVQIVGWQVS